MASVLKDVHLKWLARRAYHETFSNPGPSFLNWPGAPKRCKCGCGGVWYGRVSPTNWCTYFTPGLLVQTKFLFPNFYSLHKVIWSMPPNAWYAFQNARSISEKEGPKQRKATIIYTPIIAMLSSAVIWTLWPLSLALLVVLVCVSSGAAAIAIGMLGLTLVLSGLATVIFSSHPSIGIALIVAGILWEYERNRRKEIKHAELLALLFYI